MFVLAASDAAQAISYWPLGILAICVVFIVVSIVKFRIHPFLALILAAFLAGILTGDLPNPTTENKGLFHSKVALDHSDIEGNNLTKAVSMVSYGLWQHCWWYRPCGGISRNYWHLYDGEWSSGSYCKSIT